MNEEADKLRRNFAKYLAHDYLKNPANIADICDNSLDKTGALLGYVREAAYNFREYGVEEISEAAQHSMQRTCAACGASSWANAIVVGGKEICTVCGASRSRQPLAANSATNTKPPRETRGGFVSLFRSRPAPPAAGTPPLLSGAHPRTPDIHLRKSNSPPLFCEV